MPDKRADIAREDAQFRMMRLLETTPNISQRDMARELGVSLGTANYMLRALIERGFVKLARFSASPEKHRYAYILTPKGASEKAEITVRFLSRKRLEYAALRKEIDQLAAEVDESEGGASASEHTP